MSQNRVLPSSSSTGASNQRLSAQIPLFFLEDRRLNVLAVHFYKLALDTYKGNLSKASQPKEFITFLVQDIDGRTEDTVDYLNKLFEADDHDIFKKCCFTTKMLAQAKYKPLTDQFLRLIPQEWWQCKDKDEKRIDFLMPLTEEEKKWREKRLAEGGKAEAGFDYPYEVRLDLG